MTLKEWLVKKDLEVVCEELRELVTSIVDNNITVTYDYCGDEWIDSDQIWFIFNFEDGSSWTQTYYGDYYDDEDLVDSYDSKLLLYDIFEEGWEYYVDCEESMFTGCQCYFMESLLSWRNEFAEQNDYNVITRNR